MSGEVLMKALAIRQPWAWLIVQGIKDVENRAWSTTYRGPFYIHASQKMAPSEQIRWVEARLGTRGMGLPDDLPRGGIVGMVTLVNCVERMVWWRRLLCRLSRSRLPAGCVEQPDSEWFDGPYGFIRADARPLPFKPWRGQLGFFEVPDDLYREGSKG